MPYINNRRVCGKYSDDAEPFMNAVRPDTENNCPEDYLKCSPVTSATNTICYKSGTDPKNSCPITDIKFLVRGTDTMNSYLTNGYD